jgi:predicted alpha/beta hydrolase family esterase
LAQGPRWTCIASPEGSNHAVLLRFSLARKSKGPGHHEGNLYSALGQFEREKKGETEPKDSDASVESEYQADTIQSGNEITRPLIIIAHSMGGVVVAKVSPASIVMSQS